MRALRRFFRRLRSWRTTQHDEERLRIEIEEHLAMQTADNIRAGLPSREARRQAALKFGGVEPMRETYREQRVLTWLENLARDVRYAARGLRRAPAFTIATTLTLALGIGATTSIFTLVNAVMLQSLPVANPAALYRLGRKAHCCYMAGYSQDKEFSLVSYDLYRYLRDNTRGFSELAAFPSIPFLFGVRRAGNPEPAQSIAGEFVSGNYFAMFGLRPVAGRTLAASDDVAGAPPAVVISHRLWTERYDSNPALIGSVVQINDKPFTVVGISPAGFFGDTLRGTPPDLFLPLNAEPLVQSASDLQKYDTHWLRLIGRIAAGANQPAAAAAAIEAQMRVELKQWLRSHWGEMSPAERLKFPEQTLYLSPGGAGITVLRDLYRRWLEILMAVTGFVLLIVCANVANLMLVRGMERRRQTSLSMALGARPSRLAGQALIECLVLAVLGGAAGLAVAFAGARVILHFAFPAAPGSLGIPIDASPSIPVLLFALAASIVTGIAFGVAPAWSATHVDPIEALRGGRALARAGASSRKTLVTLQTALSLVLLSGAGLLTAALHSLETQTLGFEEAGRLVASINPILAGYRTPQLPFLYRRIHDSITSIPGVASAALCLYSPPNGGWGSSVFVDGQPVPGPRDDNSAAWDRVTAGYFDVVGTPVLRGRGIAEQDTAASPKVAVVTEAFVRKFFRNGDAVGRFFGREAGVNREFEIVGVVKDARYVTASVDEPPRAMFFLPAMQADYSKVNLGALFLHDIVIQTKPGASVADANLRRAMAKVDPNLPVLSVRSMQDRVADQFAQQRLIARLTSLFGLLSLALASIGLYGVAAYTAGRRAGEIGVRMALGASRRQIAGLVLRGAAGLIAAGLALGLPLTFAAGRLLGSQLYGVNPYDPHVTLMATLALGLSALAASFVPALRASRISPVDALRSE